MSCYVMLCLLGKEAVDLLHLEEYATERLELGQVEAVVGAICLAHGLVDALLLLVLLGDRVAHLIDALSHTAMKHSTLLYCMLTCHMSGGQESAADPKELLNVLMREAEVEALEQRHDFLQREQPILVPVGRLVGDNDPPASARSNHRTSTTRVYSYFIASTNQFTRILYNIYSSNSENADSSSWSLTKLRPLCCSSA